MYLLIQTAHKLAEIKKGTQQCIADFLLPNHTRHRAQSLQWWIQALVRSRPGHPAMTLEKTFQEGKLGCVQDMQLFLCARGDLGGVSWPLRGLLTAWCRGHVHRLAHGIGNYAETHGWPEARYSAQHYWVRPELLTDTDRLYLLCKISWTASFSANTLFTFHAAAHIGICELIWVMITSD